MKVVVAIDDSLHSKQVIDIIGHRHWPDDIQFKLVTVLEPFYDEYMPDEWRDVEHKSLSRRKEHFEQLCQTCRHKLMDAVPHCTVHYEVRNGDPRIQIIDAATNWRADKILLGAHARDVCLNSLLGSVSRAVAAHSPCSVEIVRVRQKTPAAV